MSVLELERACSDDAGELFPRYVCRGRGQEKACESVDSYDWCVEFEVLQCVKQHGS